MEKETDKQLEFIKFIQSETGVMYNGKSKIDASKYISENKSKLPIDSNINEWSLNNGYF